MALTFLLYSQLNFILNPIVTMLAPVLTPLIISFIPHLGPTLTFLPAICIALGASFFMVVKLVIVWVVNQFVERNVVEPNVMGRRLNVHPVSIIFILLIMGELLGLIGMLIGVPLYAIIRVFFNFINQKFQERYNQYYGTETD